MEDRHRFRVYDKKYREYMQGPFDKTIRAEDGTGFTVFAYKCNHLGSRGITTLFEAMAMPDRFVVEQCTGLKDRIGKMIFEDDVISIQNEDGEIFSGTVYFENGFFQTNGDSLYFVLKDYDCEIIGNTHETEA